MRRIRIVAGGAVFGGSRSQVQKRFITNLLAARGCYRGLTRPAQLGLDSVDGISPAAASSGFRTSRDLNGPEEAQTQESLPTISAGVSGLTRSGTDGAARSCTDRGSRRPTPCVLAPAPSVRRLPIARAKWRAFEM